MAAPRQPARQRVHHFSALCIERHQERADMPACRIRLVKKQQALRREDSASGTGNRQAGQGLEYGGQRLGIAAPRMLDEVRVIENQNRHTRRNLGETVDVARNVHERKRARFIAGRISNIDPHLFQLDPFPPE